MKNKQAGFTIIELVTVIILLGILAVSVLPKFFGSSDYEVYTYRTQMIAALRLTQQRAMHQTDLRTSADLSDNSNLCHEMVIDSAGKQIGIPNRRACTTIFPVGWEPDAAGVVVENNHDVTFRVEAGGAEITQAASIGFDSMGRPTQNCLGGCVINISNSAESVTIEIASEGYIHAL